MEESSTTRTRDRIPYLLKVGGPQTATQLAEQLGITPMAVRQHLYNLRDQGLVTHHDERQPVGRPSRIWELTDKSNEVFPDRHADLTVDLIEAMRVELGEQAVRRVLVAWRRRVAESMKDDLPPADLPLEERLAALLNVWKRGGFLPELQNDEDGKFLFIENHCPIFAAAGHCPELCEHQLTMFREVFGDEVLVKRREHMLGESRRCVYEISERA